MSVAWRLVDFDALSAQELEGWRKVRESDPTLDSPFFHPEFAGSVHAVFGNVHVAVDRDRQVWFPLQVRRRVARPVLTPGADFQGPIMPAGTSFDPAELVRDTGLRALQFKFLQGHRADFGPWVQECRPSPFLDVTGGLEGYLGRVGKQGRHKMKRVTNKTDRELGQVRLVWNCADPDLLDQLIEIKRSQYEVTGGYDFFARSRNRHLVHHLAQTKKDGFEGVLSAVYADDMLLAAHFGLRDRDVLHWWFPVFKREHSHLSPGWILLRELITSAPDSDVTRIDLGVGDEDYKLRSMTGSVSVCEGEVTATVLEKRLWLARRAAADRIKSSSLWPQLRTAKNRTIRAIHEGDSR
ncbi:GNAT family N-acetyltransferase [Mycobacterium sp. AMU20-3851]|uniref:GNAT family N-acetyltransferase n=1 Tax=Mycobacterium sp. AMU20-3851 TaxID=3122055 RepID=UPI003753EAA8